MSPVVQNRFRREPQRGKRVRNLWQEAWLRDESLALSPT